MYIRPEHLTSFLPERLEPLLDGLAPERVARHADLLMADALDLRLGQGTVEQEVLAAKLVVSWLRFHDCMAAAHKALAVLYETVPCDLHENGADISQAADEAWGVCVEALESLR